MRLHLLLLFWHRANKQTTQKTMKHFTSKHLYVLWGGGMRQGKNPIDTHTRGELEEIKQDHNADGQVSQDTVSLLIPAFVFNEGKILLSLNVLL